MASAIPAGHNGVFAWMWSWDPNGQMEGSADARAISTLSAYGRLWEDEYYARMATGAPVQPIRPMSPAPAPCPGCR